MKINLYDLCLKNKIYTFKIISSDSKFINFRYTNLIHPKEIQIDIKILKEILIKLNSRVSGILSKSKTNSDYIIEKVTDYIEFIKLINFNLQIEEALLQMILLVWNHKWILKNDIIELKIKDFLISLFQTNSNSRYYYFLLFKLESIKKNKNEIKYNEFEVNLDEIDYELDNLNYVDYNDDSNNYLEFIF